VFFKVTNIFFLILKLLATNLIHEYVQS